MHAVDLLKLSGENVIEPKAPNLCIPQSIFILISVHFFLFCKEFVMALNYHVRWSAQADPPTVPIGSESTYITIDEWVMVLCN